jgi:hypothetical protein
MTSTAPPSVAADALARESQRQRGLLSALLESRAAPGLPGLVESGERAVRGLAAYRANAAAVAERALASACPTVQELLGHEDFARLAVQFWRAHPPLRGDLGEWGDALPEFLETHGAFDAWPYLADMARLDFARHHCERAEDAAFDGTSLGRLADTDPAQLVLRTMPGTALLVSRWPVATLHAAHAEGSDAAFAQARSALQADRSETVVVARRGWRVAVTPLEGEDASAFMHAVMAGSDLAQALVRAGADFDFGAWLALALQHGWLKDVVVSSD